MEESGKCSGRYLVKAGLKTELEDMLGNLMRYGEGEMRHLSGKTMLNMWITTGVA